METNIDKECGVMGALFQQVITDMKVGAPLWEDFLSKASKLHTALKSTLSVIASYLDAFQKIADAATNAKGATKDIGTVLTRICLRHKAVESRLKTFTSALMECLVMPLHEKLEEWKKFVVQLDKEHWKELKKVKADIKKRSTEAQRWQKKAKKIRNANGGTMSLNDHRNIGPVNMEVLRAADAAQVDLGARLALLQETEKQALCSALVEERSHFCQFVACLKPVMNEEMAMMTELSHLEEIIGQLDKHTADPYTLPSATQEMIADLKGSTDQWSVPTPPSSPSSLGSRKSSMCSLGSMHSSSSGSVASHTQGPMHSPSHGLHHGHPAQHLRHRSLSQVAHAAAAVGVRLSSVSSQDSGFTSQDTLVLRPASSPPSAQLSEVAISTEQSTECSRSSNSSTPMSPYPANTLPNAMATWPNLQETTQYDRSANNMVNERPHTISTAYEKGHQRPALSVYTFQPFEHGQTSNSSDQLQLQDRDRVTDAGDCEALRRGRDLIKGSQNISSQESLVGSRPPLPQRCSSLERPTVPFKPAKEQSNSKENSKKKNQNQEPPPEPPCQHMVPDFHQAAPDMIVPQPVYMNASELRSQMAIYESNSNGMIYGSIGSSIAESSIYDDGQACLPLSSSSSYSSIPCSDWPLNNISYSSSSTLLRRPASFSGYADPSAMAAMEWVHRGSVRMPSTSGVKRSSVSLFATLHEVSADENHQAYYEESIAAAAAVASSDEASPSVSLDDIDLANLPPPPDFLLEATLNDDDHNVQAQKAEQKLINERSLSVAEAVKTLNEIRHQPASPGVVRRAQSMRVANETADSVKQQNKQAIPAAAKMTIPIKGRRLLEQQHQRGHHTLRLSNLQHSSSMKSHGLKGNMKTLPKHLPSQQRYPVEDEHDEGNANGRVVSGLLSQTNFVNTLNAKLALQKQHQPESLNPVAIRIRQNVAEKCISDPSLCHESLMDQIRRGTSLRRAHSSNERSDPNV